MHYSVLLEESISNLNIKEDGIYVDATLGFAGHSSEILKRIQKGYLFAFDQDIDACQASNLKLSKVGNNFKIINDNFVNIKKRLEENNIHYVDGILYDLGVSSPQLDIASRGFSYHNEARLDMRMNQNSSLSAYEVVNNYSEKELTDIFYKYGEEKYAKKIASNIVKYRENKEIVTTLELVDIIKSSIPFKAMRESHPARKVFQAIRIEVNDELNVLKTSLEDAIKLLNINGRICVITFHSLEDRIVKEIFNKYTKVNQELNNLPFIPEEYLPNYKLINTKVITPSNKELTENNRSRSAKLRVIERIKWYIMTKTKIKYFSKLERFLLRFYIFLVIVLVIGIIFGQTTLSKVNFEVEKLKEQVNKKENNNQSLTMIINEMVSLENVFNVASNMGLAYNNDNIKTIKD